MNNNLQNSLTKVTTVSFKEIEGSFEFETGQEALNFATDNQLTFLSVRRDKEEKK